MQQIEYQLKLLKNRLLSKKKMLITKRKHSEEPRNVYNRSKINKTFPGNQLLFSQ